MATGTVQLIGVDLQTSSCLPVSVLEKCHVIFVSKRFQQSLPVLYPGYQSCEIVSISPIDEAVAKIKDSLPAGDVAVLASGDPLFFGIGRRLIETFGFENIHIHPAPSSVQHTFSRFGIPWDDASFLSLHGRVEHNFVGKLLASNKTAVLTDGRNRPDVIASKLHAFLGDDQKYFTLHVAENLGRSDERLVSGTAQEIADGSFGSLCCMLVTRSSECENTFAGFGLTESDIIHSRGLITKSEVRAAAIHALGILPNTILWDVGAGSGSVGLEAARMNTDMLVYSIERNTEQHKNILDNKRKFDVFNLKLIQGMAPEALLGLPRPHNIFIGGSGGNLAEIIEYCRNELLPGGRVVVTGVLEKTCQDAPEFMHRVGLKVETRRIEVQRNVYPLREETVFNPITIIVGKKD